jgi:hypothetical protein
METSNEYIIFYRNQKKDNTECLIYFKEKVKQLKKIATKIKKWNCRKCYVFENSRIHIKASYILSILNNPFFYEKISFNNSLPLNDLTKDPQLCPVTFESATNWLDIKNLIVLQGNGWDYYELEWILKRWESSLGVFDYDNFWIASTYPMDIYNNPVHFSVVLFYIKLFTQRHSLKELKIKFFALYQFYKDKLGKLLLEFFYNETINPYNDKIELYQRIHQIYHKTNSSNPYHRYLFYNTYCITSKQKFKINLYIQQYLSFNGMYICSDFCNHRKEQLINGMEKGTLEYLQFFKRDEDKLLKEINSVNEYHSYCFQWIGKDHIKKLKSPFWKYVFLNWNTIPRNIYLWDIRVVNYNDHQMKIGDNLLTLFPSDWIQNFHDKNYKPTVRKRKKN